MDDRDLDPLSYTLPVAPRTSVDNWLPRLQAVGVITALFAGIQAQLLGGLPEDAGRPSDTALRFLTYGGMLLNLGGTLSSVLLLVAITNVPLAARRIYASCQHSFPRSMFQDQTELPRAGGAGQTRRELETYNLIRAGGLDEETQILRAFGLARGWNVLLLHCLLCFIVGSICVFVQVVLGAWLSERAVVAALVVPFAVFAALPPLYVFFFSMGPLPCSECKARGEIV